MRRAARTMTIALRQSGFFMQKERPPCRWPVTAARTIATRKPEKLVHSIDSCIVGLAFGLSGLSFLVLTFTLSCSPPVTASISSEKAISSRPYDESLAPPPFFLPPKLKMHTPTVIITTCTYSIVVYFLPPSSRPPAITGTILHDLPSTCGDGASHHLLAWVGWNEGAAPRRTREPDATRVDTRAPREAVHTSARRGPFGIPWARRVDLFACGHLCHRPTARLRRERDVPQGLVGAGHREHLRDTRVKDLLVRDLAAR